MTLFGQMMYHSVNFLYDLIDELDDQKFATAFKELCQFLYDNPNLESDDYQTHVFQIGKNHELKIKDWFTNLYNLIWEQSKGPKIGYFIFTIGVYNLLDIMTQNLLNQLMSKQ